MTFAQLLFCAPMAAMLIVAAAADWRARRIPNWLTLGLLAGGLAQSLVFGRPTAPAAAVFGALTGFGLLFALFALGAVGGGDVKLMAGLGAWLGPWLTLEVFALAAVVGMLVVVIQAAWQGRLRRLLRNSAVCALNLARVQELGVAAVRQAGQATGSVDKPLPYALPVLAATALALLGG